MSDKITRIAIVDSNRCKPKRCAQECKKVPFQPACLGYLLKDRSSHAQSLEWVQLTLDFCTILVLTDAV